MREEAKAELERKEKEKQECIRRKEQELQNEVIMSSGGIINYYNYN